jgi:hypothetical protein
LECFARLEDLGTACIKACDLEAIQILDVETTRGGDFHSPVDDKIRYAYLEVLHQIPVRANVHINA